MIMIVNKYAVPVLSLLIGACSTQPPMAPAGASKVEAKATAVAQPSFDYGANSSLRDDLDKAGALPVFETYWRAHAARDWRALFAMEHAERMPSVEFYEAYHAKAWPLLGVQVQEAHMDGTKLTLRLLMRFQDPDKKRPYSMYRDDVWQRQEGQKWRHILTDPMLKGVRQ